MYPELVFFFVQKTKHSNTQIPQDFRSLIHRELSLDHKLYPV